MIHFHKEKRVEKVFSPRCFVQFSELFKFRKLLD